MVHHRPERLNRRPAPTAVRTSIKPTVHRCASAPALTGVVLAIQRVRMFRARIPTLTIYDVLIARFNGRFELRGTRCQLLTTESTQPQCGGYLRRVVALRFAPCQPSVPIAHRHGMPRSYILID